MFAANKDQRFLDYSPRPYTINGVTARAKRQNLTVFHVANPADYSEASLIQEHIVAMRTRDSVPDCLLILEHLPVITLGRSGKTGGLIARRSMLAKRGIALCRSKRGGDITYHAPGQVILYPIMKLSGRNADVRTYVAKLEQVALSASAALGIRAFRRRGLTGAWTSQGKLAAIGVHISHWVTSHGMSYNVNLDLAGYDSIVPCGLAGERVTSLEDLMGMSCPSVVDMRIALASAFCRTFRCKLEHVFVPDIHAIESYFSLRGQDRPHRVQQ